MKVTLKIALVLGVVALVAAAPANAVCGGTDTRPFVGYSYPAGAAPADVLGSFWQLGNFGGANNGTWPATQWMADAGGGALFITGNWQGDIGIAGCPSPVGPAVFKMAYVVSAPAGGGGTVYGGGCETSDPDGGQITFGVDAPGPFPMQLVPKVTIAASNRGPGTVQATVNAPNVPGGIVDEGACGLGVQGYRVYSRVLAANAPAPVDRGRLSGGWTVASPLTAPGNPVVVNVPAADGQAVYLAYGIVLNDGVELQHVGANSTPIGSPTSADRPTDFKIIKKPIRKPTDAQ